jgi:hypothetical protein
MCYFLAEVISILHRGFLYQLHTFKIETEINQNLCFLLLKYVVLSLTINLNMLHFNY